MNAAANREPLDFLIVNTYPSNPARHGGGMRIQNLWGSMPADICAQAVVLAHTDGGPALMPLTRARPGFEQHVPFVGPSAPCRGRAAQRRDRHQLRRRRAGARGHRRRSVHPRSAFSGRRRIGRARAQPPVHGAPGPGRGSPPADRLRGSQRRGGPEGVDVPRRRGGRKAIELVTQLEAEACAHASLVVCCTEDDRRRLIERYGVASRASST